MQRAIAYILLAIAAVLVGLAAVWFAAFPQPRRETAAGVAADQEGMDRGGLRITYPLDGTLFPAEIPPPTFLWEDSHDECDTWLITVDFPHGNDPFSFRTPAAEWTPPEEYWEAIKRRSLEQPAEVTIRGVDRSAPHVVLSSAAVRISTSADEVGAPLFYREVVLPFIDAVRDPSRLRWRFGEISSRHRPPVVLSNLPVCGNCHSFSADGSVLGMDVDYANCKGSYVIDRVAEEMFFDKGKIITWDDYKRDENELSFGLLSQVSPDGRYVISTVKDRSVFVPKPDLTFSQLFFPIKGILCVYDRQTKTFRALPGADDRRLVQSNPTWSPDGKYIVFARTRAHELKSIRNRKAVLLTPDECREFLEGERTFQYDLYRIPFNDGRGGRAEPLEGASHDGMSNYFARYSPDGKWIVFCKAKSFMLLQPDSRLYIIPAGGGKPRKLRCNTGRMNSWHSWSPNGRWLVFASKANSPYTQLFLTHIDRQGRSTPPVVLSRLTAPDRAANIPEFVNLPADAIRRIHEQFLDDYSYFRAGTEFLKHGDFANAAKAYRRAVELNPQYADAMANLATSLSSQGLAEEARRYYLRALELKPDSEGIHFNFAVSLLRHRKFKEAAVHYRHTLRLNPRRFEALTGLASALVHLGQLQEAIEQYRKALSIRPDDAHVHFTLAGLLLRARQFEAAERHFSTALDLQPDDPRYHHQMGRFLQLRGQAEPAMDHYRQALRLDADFVAALNDLAWLYATSGNERLRHAEQAVTLAERAAELTEAKVATILDTLAAAYAEAGRFDEARQTASKAETLAEKAGKPELAGQIRTRLSLYLADRPFHEPAP